MSFEQIHLDRRRHGPPLLRRLLEGAATAVVWIVYLVLWAPAVVTGLAQLRVQIGWLERLDPIGTEQLIVLSRVAAVAAALGLALLLWARNEQRRFRGKERRRRRPDVARAELVRDLHADPDAAASLLTAKVAIIHHRPDGSVAAVNVPDTSREEPLRSPRPCGLAVA